MTIKYIGSSTKKLQVLEHNHRNASTIPGYSMTHFRKMLKENHEKQGAFRWLVKPHLTTLIDIEKLEGELIRKYMPEYNQDYYPEKSSLERGRYNDPKASELRYRGVYCFEV